MTMTEREYSELPGVRSSWLKVLHTKTPAHLREEIARPERDTEAFRIGRAIHTAVLRPDAWDDEWLVIPRLDRRTKAGKEEAARLATEAGDRYLIDEADAAMVTRIRTEVFAVAGDILRQAPLREWPVVGVIDGVAGKARVDACAPTGLMLDLKSTLSAAPHAFARAAGSYGYLLQMAYYRMLMREMGMDDGPTILIAVEKSAPYAVGLYSLAPEQMAEMEPRIRELLRLYQRCCDDNYWPAYQPEITTLRVPDWAVRGEDTTDEV